MLAAWCATAVEVDGIAATVGSSSILRSEVETELARYGSKAGLSYDDVLNRMVDRKLILKAAQTSKLTMQDWIVDNRVREIIDASFDGDRNKLIASLSRDKLSYADFRQRVKDDLIVAAMRWNVVEKNVTASPSAMRSEYDENAGSYLASGKVTVSVIVLNPDDAAKRGEVDAALETEKFGDVAKRFSAGANAESGGLYKDIHPEEEFNPSMCEAIASTKVGETSQWIDIDGWSFLIRKESETPAHAKTFEEAYADVEAAVRSRRTKELYDRWLDRLKSETFIKIFDRK